MDRHDVDWAGYIPAITTPFGDDGAILWDALAAQYFGLPTNALGYDLASVGHGDGLMGAGGVLGSDHPGFWDAVADGDRERALALGARDRVLMERWFGPDYGGRFGSAQAIMKAALRMRGVPAGTVRPPLLELEPAELAIVEATLRELGIEPVAAA